MALFAISDLHLSFYKNKPMDIFGDIWKNHFDKIKKNWEIYISKDDTVLIPGDISWAKNMAEFQIDLQYINDLKGKKIFLQGNHDYWWGSTYSLNNISDDLFFLKNDFFPFGDYAICGSRGWVCPNDTRFTEHDEKIYLREVSRLTLSLELAKSNGFSKFIVAMHFPPTNDKKEKSMFTDIIEQFNVETVVYGHLHGQDNFDLSYKGKVGDTFYYLVSADFLKFVPIKIF